MKDLLVSQTQEVFASHPERGLAYLRSSPDAGFTVASF